MDHHTAIGGGLPCIARVTHFTPGYAAKTNADPWDCYEAEPPEIEFDLLTTRGKPAKFLEKLMTDSDRERISNELLEQV